MQVRNVTWFKQGAEQEPGDNSSIYASTEKSKGRFLLAQPWRGPASVCWGAPSAVPTIPSLWFLQCQQGAPGQCFGISQMIQSHMKGLQGSILLIPPPLLPIFLALYLHSAFKHDLYHLLSRCAAPCLALTGGQPLSAAGTCCSFPGLEQQLVWKKWALSANTWYLVRRGEETNTTQMELCLSSASACKNRLVNPFLKEGFHCWKTGFNLRTANLVWGINQYSC